MHVRENLLAAERRKHVAQFGQDLREAVVAVGPPSAAFKEVIRAVFMTLEGVSKF